MHGVAYLEIEYGQAAGVRYIFPSALYVSLICLPVIIFPSPAGKIYRRHRRMRSRQRQPKRLA